MSGHAFLSVAAAVVVLAVVWLRPSASVWLAWLGLALSFYAIWWIGRLPGR
jgi:hypothetical protein